MNKKENSIKIFDLLKNKWPILLIALAGLLLLVFGGGYESNDKNEMADYLTAAQQYRAELEAKLADLCSGIEGAGRVRSVMVTLESGEEYVWAENTDADGSGDVVITNKEGILVRRTMPKVRGVAVVCTGGGSDRVRRELTEAISAALGVATSRIHISAGEIS